MARKGLKTLLSVACAGLLAIAAAAPASAGGIRKDTHRFIGLWEGIDRLDGSTVQVSISDTDDDGTLEVLYRESVFSVGCAPSGLGVYVGDGTVTEPKTMVVEGIITCFNEDYTAVSTDDLELTARADWATGTMSLGAEEFGGDALILHRTSK